MLSIGKLGHGQESYYLETVAMWREAGVPVWGTVPERVTIAAGPDSWLSTEGLEAYTEVWRRARRATFS